MAEPRSFGEQLRADMLAVRAHNAELARLADEADLKDTGLRPQHEEAEVEAFVGGTIKRAIERVREEAEAEAKHGRGSSKTTWGFNGESDDPELPLNLLRYRGLKEQLVRHFTELGGVVVTEVDTRSGYPWRVDDPESGVEWEWRQSPHRVIGIALSWEIVGVEEVGEPR